MLLYFGPILTLIVAVFAIVQTVRHNSRRVAELREAGELADDELPESTASPPFGGLFLAVLQLYLNFRIAHLGDALVATIVVGFAVAYLWMRD